MLYKLAHILKERFGFIWDFVEWGNATAFSLIHRQQLKSIPQVLADCSGEYQFRLAKPTDVSTLVTFFANQPEEAYEFFKPHDFDATSIKKVIDNKAFLSIVVWKEQTIVGYFFLRCFVNGKCFRGKIVDKNWQGRGIAKQMGIVMTKVSQALGMRMFGSISPENYASLASAKASNEIKIHQTLDNGYYYIEFLPKQD
jgi:hypothetical protein